MKDQRRSQIVGVLLEIGTKQCVEKAETLAKEGTAMRSINLRGLALNSSNVIAIANCLNEATSSPNDPLQSISFSYNTSLGDLGAIALSENIPASISQIGLVNCGIGDTGGTALLHWMHHAPQLQMICIEQNNFSAALKLKYRKFARTNPQILVVT